ncbi:MAG: prepilin-type N-terminal cleavage/methylation domain-containing protein [Candidatus Saccharibacteria bacterium]
MLRRGFTIVEIIIVITVMGILLILGVVNLSSSQISSRDAERKSDVETIAMHLETFYNSGTDGSSTIGRYPSIAEMTGLPSQIKNLRDIDPRSLKSPGETNTSLIGYNGGIDIPAINKYTYWPRKSDKSPCNATGDECRSFTIIYKLEKSTPECPAMQSNQCTLMSKNQ